MKTITSLVLSIAFAFALIGCQTTGQCPLHKQQAAHKCGPNCGMKCGDKCASMCGKKCE